MRTIIVTILTAGMALAALPYVSADETKADCEPGQDWIGYKTSRDVKNFYDANSGTHPARISGACEGEHWDGQDTVNGGFNPGTSGTCTATDQSAPTIGASTCMNADPNDGSASVAGLPVRARASGTSSSTGAEAYLVVDIAMVGRTGAYQGLCLAGGSLEGDACAGKANTRTAWYGRDNTNQATGGTDVLATAISTTGITKGHASEADCDQATYKAGAESGDKSLCGRDNTAITVQTVLP